MDTKREIVDGYAYVSGNGQLVIDRHFSDEEHLLSPATRKEQPLYDCRKYLKDLIPAEWLDRPGKFLIDRTVTTTGEIVAVQLAFIPRS
jgi:hypothetical protein